MIGALVGDQSMGLVLQPSGPAPSVQIRQQITDRAASGDWVTGTRLPTVRALAADLGIAPGTVAKAYRELEDSGVIETRGRSGSFIAARDGVDARLLEEAGRFAALCAQSGLNADQAAERVRTAFTALR